MPDTKQMVELTPFEAKLVEKALLVYEREMFRKQRFDQAQCAHEISLRIAGENPDEHHTETGTR